MTCKYRDILGVPGQGVHSVRVFGVAAFDVVATFVGAWILSRMFKTPYLQTLGVLFLLGILLHRLFCVKTTVDQALR